MDIYTAKGYPHHYVVISASGVWLVRNQPYGWDDREPYSGTKQDITPLSATDAQMAKFACNIPE